MVPMLVPRSRFSRGLEGIGAAFFEPFVDVVMVKLLAPKHSGQSLTHDVGLIDRQGRRNDGCVKLIGLRATGLQRVFEIGAERGNAFTIGSNQGGRCNVGKPEPNHRALSGIHGQAIMGRDFRSLHLGIYRRGLATDEIVVDAVLDIGGPVRNAKDPLGVGFVLREQQGNLAFAVEKSLAQLGIDGRDDALS